MNQPATDNTSSFLFLTAEIRWFRKGDIPADLHSWFHKSKYIQRYGSRIDTYLLFPNAETVGVKFRENRFEIKSFVKKLDPVFITDHIRGIPEVWEKWSLAGNSVSWLFSEMGRDPSIWVDVKKSRTIIKYSADGEEILEMDASGTQGLPGDGCYAELTEVDINGKLFWTIGFEAFSKRKDIADNLIRTVRCFFNSIEIHLPEEESFSYPTLLKRIYSEK